MTAPVLARQVFGGGRVYRHPKTGEEAPSITTILGVLDKPALPRWAAKEAAEYAATHWPALSALPARDRVKLIKAAPWDRSGDAASVGDRVHDAIDLAIKGNTTSAPYDLDIVPFMDAFADFTDTWRPEWVTSEFTVWNRAVGYAGTGDFIARVGGLLVLGDHKTGKGVYPEAALQLHALAHAEAVVRPDGTEDPLPEIDRLAVLHLRPHQWELIEVHRTPETWAAFQYAARLHAWKRTQEHTVFGARRTGTVQ